MQKHSIPGSCNDSIREKGVMEQVKPIRRETPIIEFRNVCKSFPGVRALDDISMKVWPGEVHCLLGENGAGKSTLMKILTGVYHPDSGEILVNGEKVTVDDIHQAQRLHIGTVFQENSLIPHLSVAENVFLTREIKNQFGLIDWAKMYAECTRWCEELGVQLDPKARVDRLSVAQQQIVEIVKMFSQNPHIVILDEPTSALSDHEIDNLFDIILRMQARDITFIYISHRMEEIKRIGNSGTVLRDGRLVAAIDDVQKIEMDEIIKMIVGRTLDEKFPKRTSNIGDVLLEVEGLTVPKLIYDISFSVRKGEVLGFSGLVGSGRTTTAKALFGALHHSAGKIKINHKEVQIHSPHDAIRHGIGLLPENRKEEGLVLNQPVAWNVSFASVERYRKRLLLDRQREKTDVLAYVDQLAIKTPDIRQQVKLLSGGNQQKVVFAKWMCAQSGIYIFDEPTRGIDVGAKTEIYNMINMLVAEGNAVIVISSELPEILGICDRILVFCEGYITADIDRQNATQENIMYYAIGGT